MFWRREASWVALGCVDSGDDVGIVLELVEVRIGCCASVRERVRKERVVWTVGECVHDVGEIEVWWLLVNAKSSVLNYLLTIVLQMHSKLQVTMTTSCNMEISLHFVAFNGAKDTASISRTMQTRSLLELLPGLPRSSQIVMNVFVFTLAVDMIVQFLAQCMRSPLLVPLCPNGRVLRQHIAGQNAVPCSVLNINVYIGAFHGDHDI